VNTKSSSRNYDLLILGGGMVGAAFAALVARTGLSIGLLERSSLQWEWPVESHDIRVSAITHASQSIFEQIGAWKEMQEMGAYAYRNMQVWDQSGDGIIHFSAEQVNRPNLGHIIENRIIQKALQKRLMALQNVDFIEQVTPIKIEFNGDGCCLDTASGERYQAPLIIGADGAHSWLREKAEIELTQWSYEQTAVVTTVQTEHHHEDTCWQQFMPNGPLAFLPLNAHYSSIVWSTSHQQAKYLLSLDAVQLAQQLRENFEHDFGEIRISSAYAGFPLKMRHARHYVKPGLALIGDAIHTVHPLAGQGVNLGLQDAVQLADVLLTAVQQQRDYAALHTLRKYERSRKGDNLAMLGAMDGFKRGFSNNNKILRLIRNQALNQVNHSPLLKSFFMHYALG